MKTYKEIIESLDEKKHDLKAGQKIVSHKSIKLGNGMAKDGDEYEVRTVERERILIKGEKGSFYISWQDYEKYFDS